MEGEIWFERMNFDQFGRRLEQRHFWFLTNRPYDTVWTIRFYLFYLFLCYFKNNNNNIKRKSRYSRTLLDLLSTIARGGLALARCQYTQSAFSVCQTNYCMPSGLALARSTKPLKFPILTFIFLHFSTFQNTTIIYAYYNLHLIVYTFMYNAWFHWKFNMPR